MVSSTDSPGTPKTEILIIDDEERIRDACYMVLTDQNFSVATAADGEQGLAMIRKTHYDIALVDLMMPGTSGFDVLSEVRKNHPDTVVIVITGYATLEHSIEAMKKGAFDFIPKPFTPEQLKAVIDKSLKYTCALQDIAESKSRLGVMVDRLTDGVMTTDASKKIVQANPAFLHMIGYHGKDVIGKYVEEILHNEKLQQDIDEALLMPMDTFSEITGEITFDNNKEEKIFGSKCSPFRGRTGENIGIIIVLHDITALKQMDQMKSDFVSMVSHEIRSPMNSLLMQLKNIKDGLAGEVTDKQAEILTRASEKILNLNELVTELLDLSRIESGLISHEKEKVDIAELLQQQQSFHGPYAEGKEIKIHVKCEENLPQLMANRLNLEEVLSNLITNSIKYSPQKAVIDLSAVGENEYVKLILKDTGYGIGKEDLEKIFTRFYRVKDANTRHIQGTGLGLAIVKSIVEAHHGKISVDSTPGKGTTFTILLPVSSS